MPLSPAIVGTEPARRSGRNEHALAIEEELIAAAAENAVLRPHVSRAAVAIVGSQREGQDQAAHTDQGHLQARGCRTRDACHLFLPTVPDRQLAWRYQLAGIILLSKAGNPGKHAHGEPARQNRPQAKAVDGVDDAGVSEVSTRSVGTPVLARIAILSAGARRGRST